MKIINEANSTETANSISVIIQGLYSTLAQLDELCRKASNGEEEIIKKELDSLVSEVNTAKNTIRRIVKSYKPSNATPSNINSSFEWTTTVNDGPYSDNYDEHQCEGTELYMDQPRYIGTVYVPHKDAEDYPGYFGSVWDNEIADEVGASSEDNLPKFKSLASAKKWVENKIKELEG